MANDRPTEPASPTPSDPTPPARRKRRKWPWVVLALLLILVLLVVFAPTIASTGPVRSFVVAKINDNLNGKVTIDNWSLGWTSGINVRGVRVYDEQSRLILEMAGLRTDLSLLDAARGNLALGETTIDSLNLVQVEIDENGQTNYQKLAKQGPPSAEPPATTPSDEPTELPTITGNIEITDLRGTIVVAGAGQPVFIEPSQVAVSIPDINQPITNDVSLVLRVGDNPPGTIKLNGQADIAEQGRLAIEKLTANEKVEITALDLAAASGFLKMAKVDLTLAGVMNGALDLNAAGTTEGKAQGEIVIDNLSASGAALNGDTFATSRMALPVQVAISTADPNRTVLAIQQLGVQMPEATLAVTGTVTQQVLQRLAEQKPPGDEGQLSVAINAPDLSRIANQLPNTLNLVEGVQITGGQLAAATNLRLSPETAAVDAQLDLSAQGTNNGQPITLQPIHSELNATLAPRAGETPDVRDLMVKLTSEFAQVQAEAQTLSALNLTSKFDLKKLQNELGQFVEFGEMDLAGTGDLAVTTRGDVRQTDQPLAAHVKLNLADLRVAGAVPDLNLSADALAIAGDGTYSSGTVTLDQPLTVAMQQLNIADMSGQAILNDEDIDLAVAGVVSTSEQETTAKLSTLRLTTSSDFLRVQTPEGQPLAVSMHQDGSFQGNGELALGADLKRLSDLSESFAASSTQPAEPQPANQIESGRLDGTIRFARATQPTTEIEGEFNVTNLTVGELLNNEQVAIKLTAAAPDDMASLAASANVTSAFANVSLADAQLLLKTESGGDVGPYDMVRKAVVQIDAPDLAKAYALIESAMPPPAEGAIEDAEAPPLDPLEIRRGALTTKIDVVREGGSTRLAVTEMRVSRLVLRRGERRFALGEGKDIQLQLAANLNAAGEEINAIEVTQLTGDLGIAKLAMTQPIAIQNPTGNFAASGAVELTGTLDDLGPLIETLQGAEFPYRGQYAVQQNISTQGDVVTLAGNINTSGFQVLEAGEVVFAEEQVAIANNVSVDPGKQAAQISELTVSMKSSNAANARVQGALNHWGTRRQFKDMTVDLAYDLEQLWKIIFPMLAPETQEQLKTLQVAGKGESKLTVAGTFPATQPTSEAIQSLDVQGNFPIAMVDYEGSRIENLDPAFRLRGGVFRFTKEVSGGFNGGTLDLSRGEVDLREETPRLSFPKNHQLVKGATINPLLGNSLGKFVNPVFANSSRARGQLDVKIDYLEGLALGEALKTPESGRMRMHFSLLEMDIANPLGELVLGELTKLPLIGQAIRPRGFDVFSGNIRNAVVTVENGRTTQDITMEIIDPKAAEEAAQVITGKKPEIPIYPLRFQGDINMSSLAQSLTMTIPPGLLDKWGGGDLVKVFPSGLPLSLGGTTVKPKVDLGNIGSKLIEGQLGNLGGGSGGGSSNDPLGGLLEGVLGGNRDKDDENDQKSETPEPKSRERKSSREREK